MWMCEYEVLISPGKKHKKIKGKPKTLLVLYLPFVNKKSWICHKSPVRSLSLLLLSVEDPLLAPQHIPISMDLVDFVKNFLFGKNKKIKNYLSLAPQTMWVFPAVRQDLVLPEATSRLNSLQPPTLALVCLRINYRTFPNFFKLLAWPGSVFWDARNYILPSNSWMPRQQALRSHSTMEHCTWYIGAPESSYNFPSLMLWSQ